jgi:hypothetical protein
LLALRLYRVQSCVPLFPLAALLAVPFLEVQLILVAEWHQVNQLAMQH